MTHGVRTVAVPGRPHGVASFDERLATIGPACYQPALTLTH